jgi:hypothetical protein
MLFLKTCCYYPSACAVASWNHGHPRTHYKGLFGSCPRLGAAASQVHLTPGVGNQTPGVAAWARRDFHSSNQTSPKCFSGHYCLTLFFLILIVSSVLFSNAFCFLQDPQPHRLKPICHPIRFNIPLVLLLSILAPTGWDFNGLFQS